MNRPRLGRLVSMGALLCSLLFVASAEALVTPTRVLGERRVTEMLPFANDTWLAWTANSTDHPRHFDAYVQMLAGGSAMRLNEGGTEGFTGSFEPGTNTAVYQQVDGRNSNLYIYDLDTDDRSRVPDVNTRMWEWSPRISSGYVLFNRDSFVHGHVVTTMYLYNRSTDVTRVLRSWNASSVSAPTGSVGDDYATYTVCTRTSCDGYVYSISERTRSQILTDDDRPIYAPAVDEANGDLYFLRSGSRCGQNVALWRLPVNDLNGDPTRIADFGDGFDSYTGVGSLAPNNAVLGSQDYYYDRFVCRNGEVDIFAARDATSVTTSISLRFRGRAVAAPPIDRLDRPDDLR